MTPAKNEWRRWKCCHGSSRTLYGPTTSKAKARPLAGSAQIARKARTRGAAISVSTARPGGAFLSSLFENWESEFLQMRTYVVLTAYLMQRGSPESKDLDEPSPQDRDPVLDADRKDATDCLQRAHRGARVRSPGRRRLRPCPAL
ncbi:MULTISPECIES: DUF6766 family protein [unclassified Brevundimonas]|uniref:DUF6766 family protein n=1 Tax=unclassified Brevundimonas TaxID=2622653 RepID=UPI0028A8AC40|nr:DUF6766 family protein [Brevundimonas sp.]